MAGDRAVNIQHIVLGIDPPYLEEREGEREEADERILNWNYSQGRTSSKPSLCVFVCPCECSGPSVHNLWCTRFPSCRASFSLWKLWLDPRHRWWTTHTLTLLDYEKPTVHVWHRGESYTMCVSMCVCLTPPGPEAPGLRWVLVCPWVAGWPLKPHRFITPWKPLPMLQDKHIFRLWWYKKKKRRGLRFLAKPKTYLSSRQHAGTKRGQEVRKEAMRRTYDLAVTSTYWPGRKCAAYRGVPEHTTNRITLLNLYNRVQPVT